MGSTSLQKNDLTDMQTPAPGAVSPSNGPIIGTIIVIVMLALGGAYYYQKAITKKPADLPLILGDSEVVPVNATTTVR